MTTPTVGPATPLSELERLVAVSTQITNGHLNDSGSCVICGSAWPGERASLAERIVAGL